MIEGHLECVEQKRADPFPVHLNGSWLMPHYKRKVNKGKVEQIYLIVVLFYMTLEPLD